LLHLQTKLKKGKKGTILLATLPQKKKPAKSIKHLPGPTNRIKSMKGYHHLCVLGTQRHGLSHYGYQE
jgi:hypothetical protein